MRNVNATPVTEDKASAKRSDELWAPEVCSCRSGVGRRDGQAERMCVSFTLDHSGCADMPNLNVTLSAPGHRLRLSYLVTGTVIAQVASCVFPQKEGMAVLAERSGKKKNTTTKTTPC